MGGKVNIYRRDNSDNWQCSIFLNGRNWRVSTHENSLGRAKNFAEDWYLKDSTSTVGGRSRFYANFMQVPSQGLPRPASTASVPAFS